VIDQTQKGRPLRMLPVVDEFTRECLSVDVARSLTSQNVVARLQLLSERQGAPDINRSDNGPELIAHSGEGMAQGY